MAVLALAASALALASKVVDVWKSQASGKPAGGESSLAPVVVDNTRAITELTGVIRSFMGDTVKTVDEIRGEQLAQGKTLGVVDYRTKETLEQVKEAKGTTIGAIAEVKAAVAGLKAVNQK